MNKKGFVLMETIIVIVVISVALLTIFSSYNRILTKVKKENKYDTSEYIYITKYIKDYLKDRSISIYYHLNTNSYSTIGNYVGLLPGNVKDLYGIEKIYILTGIDSGFSKFETKFDAYMIDYIRKLDVRDNDELIIVEYKKAAKDIHGNEMHDTKGNILYETYIASLEW